MIYCGGCFRPLNDVAGICPYCGAAVYKSPVKTATPDSGSLNIGYARTGRGRRAPEALPRDERLLRIISDFEIRTDVVYKPPRTPGVYHAPYSPGTPRAPSGLSPGAVILNVALAVLLPPVGFIRALVIILKKDMDMKNLGLVMLILSVIMLIAVVSVGITAIY